MQLQINFVNFGAFYIFFYILGQIRNKLRPKFHEKTPLLTYVYKKKTKCLRSISRDIENGTHPSKMRKHVYMKYIE